MSDVRLHAFPDSLAFAAQLGRAIGVRAARVAVHRFPDGERLVRVRSPAGGHAVLVHALRDPDARLIETLLAADALRRAGAARVTLVAPYLPYMRQDRVFTPGEPISQRVVGALLARAFDRVLTIEPHLHRVGRLSTVLRGGRAVSAAPAIAAWVRRRGPDVLLVGPDAESLPWVRAIARLAGAPYVIGGKLRLGDHHVRLRFPVLPPCRRAIVVDDIASSGGTLATAARALRALGVPRVEAVVVHAIFAPGARARLRAAGVRTLVSCDTVLHPTNAIPTAPLLAAALGVARRARAC
ncbi:MAG: ribose-phosphate diphosphokinase [Candidatus Binatia bacterium]